jgi:hypothetical protein
LQPNKEVILYDKGDSDGWIFTLFSSKNWHIEMSIVSHETSNAKNTDVNLLT